MNSILEFEQSIIKSKSAQYDFDFESEKPYLRESTNQVYCDFKYTLLKDEEMNPKHLSPE